MRTRPRTTFIALILGTGISAAWLSAVVIGMQSPAPPAMRTIELPQVVVVAHRASAPQATAQSKPFPAKNG
jgi:hypothetical protein